MRYPKQPKTIFVALLLVCVWFTTACGTERYNAVTEKTKDQREKDTRVYGDGKDQPARQTKVTYPDPADGQARADAIREKFYGKSGGAAPAPVAKDTTATPKKDTTAKKTDEKKM
ncbi:MAG: hypothetical protein EAZ95_02140 [Bacteroidetes bacterium]|nr:MAG: hypothetical protein EAZ95_02140 [Bacteroidota bacterium]